MVRRISIAPLQIEAGQIRESVAELADGCGDAGRGDHDRECGHRACEHGVVGTGSWPPWHHGWQRMMRRKASKLPHRLPCFSSASIAYAEQLGVERQSYPSQGLMK